MANREIVKQDFKFGIEEGFPTLCEMVEEGGFVFEQLVVALIEAVDLGQAEVAAEQVGHGAMVEPVAVQTLFAAGADQAVNGNRFQDVGPPGSLPTDGQTLRPKVIQAELLPELATQPARTPLPGPQKLHSREPYAHCGNLALVGIQG